MNGKKSVLCLIVGLFLIIFAGCNQKQTESPTAPPAKTMITPAPAESAPTTAPVNSGSATPK